MRHAVAIETSGQVGSVALVEGDTILPEATFPHGLRHAAGLIPLIDRLCRARDWSARDINEIYLSIGPGSFTGLRLAVTFAKTFALATGAKVVAVPTLSVLVENAPPEAADVIVVLDAKRDQIFTARYTRATPDQVWSQVEPAHVDTLAAMLARAPRPVVLLGEGIPFHRQFIPADSGIDLSSEDSWRARATTVARLGVTASARGDFADVLRLAPTYIRLPEAEEKWAREMG